MFEQLIFYNDSIEEQYIKCLNNIDMLPERPFYNELKTSKVKHHSKNIKKIIVKTSKAFRQYPRSYKIEIIDSKHLSVQLTISKPNIEDLFKDILDKIKDK